MSDESKKANPFRLNSKRLARRKSLPNRPASPVESRRCIKTTRFKQLSKMEKRCLSLSLLDKPRKNSIIREAVLKLCSSDPTCLSDNHASALLEEACKLSISQ